MQDTSVNFNAGQSPQELNQSEKQVLKTIFGDRYLDAWIAVSGAWTGGRVRHQWDKMPSHRSHYFASALLRPGAHDRNDLNFEAGYTITLDDVGTKMDRAFVDAFAPLPTIIVETSAGNHQYVYVLETPERDARRYGAMQEGIKTSPTWHMAGDGTGLARYQRLPGGTNHKNGFHTKLVEHHPGRTYSLDALAEHFEVDLSPDAVARFKRNDELGRRLPDEELENDPLYRALVNDGLVTHALRPQNEHGWIDIVCPWEHEHTHQGTGGAAYHADNGFKCHHTACQGRDGTVLRTQYWEKSHYYRELTFPSIAPDDLPPETPETPFKGTRRQKLAHRLAGSSLKLSPLIHKTIASTEPVIQMAMPNPSSPTKTSLHLQDIVYDPNAVLRIPPRMSTFFQRGQVTLLAAMPGIGKSLYATQLAVATAYEDPSPIGEGKIEHCGDVIIIAQEDPRTILNGRIHAIVNHFQLSNRKHDIHLITQSGVALFGRPRANMPIDMQGWDIWEYVTQVAETRPLALVVIDTLSAALTGLDENSNTDMQQVSNMLVDLAKNSAAAIVVVHHVSKGGRDEDGDFDMYSARGASSLAGAVRDMVIIAKPNAQERTDLHLQKKNPYVKLVHAKSSYQMARDEVWFEWVSRDLPALKVDGSAGSMSYGVLVPSTLSQAAQASAWAAGHFQVLQDHILKTKAEVRVSTWSLPTTLRGVLGITNADQKALLDTLTNDGLIIVKKTVDSKGHPIEVVELAPNP